MRNLQDSVYRTMSRRGKRKVIQAPRKKRFKFNRSEYTHFGLISSIEVGLNLKQPQDVIAGTLEYYQDFTKVAEVILYISLDNMRQAESLGEFRIVQTDRSHYWGRTYEVELL